MTNLSDKTKRQELINRYLNAETTIEEERLLTDFFSQANEVLTAEEEDARLLLRVTSRLAGEFELSEDKVNEFDQLTAKKQTKRARTISICWIASAAAAVLWAFFFIPGKKDNETHPSYIDNEHRVTKMMNAANFQREQVESYQLNLVGDATIVTTILADGTTASYIICSSENNNRYHVIPMNKKSDVKQTNSLSL